MDCFNSRARKGRDRCCQLSAYRQTCFNSRARKGRDQGCAFDVPNWDVSIHAPARGATWQHNNRKRKESFNSRARKGRDGRTGGQRVACGVSIHAPARGATQRARDRRAIKPVSIHAPARGATPASRAARVTALFQFTRPQGARLMGMEHGFRVTGFNSRARKGRDKKQNYLWRSKEVSIHAPARGATFPVVLLAVLVVGFNSRARKGRDYPSTAIRVYK